MRALVLILAVVVLIATIEASYSTLQRTAARGDENDNDRASHHKHHRNLSKDHKGYHHGKHGGSGSGDGHLLKSVSESANRIEEEHTKRDPGERRFPYKSHKGGEKYISLKPSYSHRRPDLPVTKDYAVDNEVSPHNHPKEKKDRLRVRIERVNKAREEHVESEPKPDTTDVSHFKVTDTYRHTYEDIARNALPDKKSSGPFSKAAHNDRDQSDRSHKDETFAYKYQTGSDPLHKAHIYMRASCSSDADCDGGCCVQLKNGKSRCKMPNTRSAGHKCANSCVCQADLKCFVSTFRKNGHKKTMKEGQRLLGHCMSENVADLQKGYFLPQKTVASNMKT